MNSCHCYSEMDVLYTVWKIKKKGEELNKVSMRLCALGWRRRFSRPHPPLTIHHADWQFWSDLVFCEFLDIFFLFDIFIYFEKMQKRCALCSHVSALAHAERENVSWSILCLFWPMSCDDTVTCCANTHTHTLTDSLCRDETGVIQPNAANV